MYDSTKHTSQAEFKLISHNTPQGSVENRLSPASQMLVPPSSLARPARRPISASHALKLRDVEIVILEDRCKGCSFCIEFCPKDVLELDTKLNFRGAHPPRVKDSASCVGCGVCEEVCPDFAIFLAEKGERR
jgi:2-oxoglutarate ferredoxin oxidoreductase subunit delta